MKTVKQQALELIQKLPDDCRIEDIRYRIHLLESVTAGLQAVEEGRVIPHEEAMRTMKEWLESCGQTQP